MTISNKSFTRFLNSIIYENNKLLIGISGGIDSMVLFDLCSKNIPKNQLHGIHVNHNLTHQAHDYEIFVKNKFIEKNIPLTIKSEIRNSVKGESMEMWGRRIRYENYFKTLDDLKFHYVITAHHADDNIETILMNIQQGCSIKGLRGIVPKNRQIIRPMLNYKKSDINSYAKKNNIDFIHDISNDDISIKRNYVRKCIVPKLIEKDSLIVNKFSNISQKSQNAILKEKVLMRFLAMKITKSKNDNFNLNDSDVSELNTYFKIRLIKEIIGESDISWRRHKYNLIKHFIVKSKTGSKLEINKSWIILRDRSKWILSYNRAKKSKINIDRFGYHHINDNIISFKKTDKQNFQSDLNIELIDFDKIKNKSIQIRNWMKGDKFQPFGMSGSKKVSDYLIDIKVDCFNKEKQLVVTADDEIIWLCGQRLSDKVRVTNETINLMELSIFK